MAAIAIAVASVLLFLLEVIRNYKELGELISYLLEHPIPSIILCCLIGLATAIVWGIYIVREEESIRNREEYRNELEGTVKSVLLSLCEGLLMDGVISQQKCSELEDKICKLRDLYPDGK